MKRCLNSLFILFAAYFLVVAQTGIGYQSPDNPLYLHIAHTRTNANPNMDAVVESLDYSIYDMLWLGGDMAISTSTDDLTMDHVDSFLEIGDENTLWALCNYDYADLDRVQAYTCRPAYYAYHKNNITFLVLDSQDSLSNVTGLQKELFFNVTDTIAESSQLIILHHKLIWMYGDSYLQPQIPYITNGGFGDCFYYINPNNFYTDLYPELADPGMLNFELLPNSPCIDGGSPNSPPDEDGSPADIGAYFVSSWPEIPGDLIINEYYSNTSMDDPEDWIELYNKGNVGLDISGWYIMDGGND